MFFFYVNALHFSKRFMGLAAVVGSAFTLLGILLFHRVSTECETSVTWSRGCA